MAAIALSFFVLFCFILVLKVKCLPTCCVLLASECSKMEQLPIKLSKNKKYPHLSKNQLLTHISH